MAEPDKIIGEDSLIAGYLAPLAAGFPGAFGLTDDCAALTPEPGTDLVLKTDAVAEGVHFLPGDEPGDIAWKALAVNVSDLAAKGARPFAYLMSLAFPEAPTRRWMERFAAGLRVAQDQFGMHLVGGDTDRRPGAPLSITMTAMGSVPSGRMVRRGTARPGDILFVTGTLGDSGLGLGLRRGAFAAQVVQALTAGERDWLERRYLRPEPRTELREILLAEAQAAMDLSDGLLKDLGRMCRASGVSAEISFGDLPLSDPARKLMAAQPDLRSLAMTGGDDYEILASVAEERVANFKAGAQAAGCSVTAIGRVGQGTGVEIRDKTDLGPEFRGSGYDHFSGR
jgi:thiamine-monophosphate kinase